MSNLVDLVVTTRRRTRVKLSVKFGADMMMMMMRWKGVQRLPNPPHDQARDGAIMER